MRDFFNFFRLYFLVRLDKLMVDLVLITLFLVLNKNAIQGVYILGGFLSFETQQLLMKLFSNPKYDYLVGIL